MLNPPSLEELQRHAAIGKDQELLVAHQHALATYTRRGTVESDFWLTLEETALTFPMLGIYACYSFQCAHLFLSK